jgi:hypothetical protein
MFPALMAWLAQPAAATLVTAGSAAVSTYAQSRNANKLANQGTDLGKLRREAEANGFNPLTVLRATGGQGFKQDVSMGSGALASAAFFNSFAGLGQNIAQAKQQEASLKNTLASTANYTAQTRSLSTTAYGQLGPNGVDPTRTKVQIGDVTSIPANISDAEVFEQRYGEVGAAVAGIGILAADTIVTTILPVQDTPGSFKPGPLSLNWFKQTIDNARSHPDLPNNYVRNGL